MPTASVGWSEPNMRIAARQNSLRVDSGELSLTRGSVADSARQASSDTSRALEHVAGVILAGSQPWGVCPLERIVPRPLVPIANTPLIQHQLRWLAGGGIREVGICGNGYTDVVRKHLTRTRASDLRSDGLRLDYFQDISPRGPAGCARDAGLASQCETIVVSDGSVIPSIAVEDVVSAHIRTGAGLTVAVASSPNTSGPRGESMTPVGVYVFNRSVLEHVPALGYQDIKETLIPKLHRAGVAIVSYRTKSVSPRVHNVDSYLAVNDWMCACICNRDEMEKPTAPENYRWQGSACVHQSARIDDSARLIGPVLVGPATHIGPGVTIIGPTTIGRGCKIDDGAVIGRSCVWDDCTVGRGVVLDRCILASGSAASDGSGVARRFLVFSSRASRRTAEEPMTTAR